MKLRKWDTSKAPNGFSKAIMEYLNKTGYTLEELGSKLGITKQTMSNYVTGTTVPGLIIYFAFAYLFNEDPYELYNRCNNGSD